MTEHLGMTALVINDDYTKTRVAVIVKYLGDDMYGLVDLEAPSINYKRHWKDFTIEKTVDQPNNLNLDLYIQAYEGS
jgi:hypothetical protein